MDLSKIKEALDDEMFLELETYINDLTGQRDEARNESINKRKGLQKEVETLKAQQADLLEKLGIDSVDQIEEIQSQTGAADQVKQLESKVRTLERKLAEKDESIEGLSGKYKSTREEVLLREAIDGHKFIAKDLVLDHVKKNLVWEDDQVFFKNDDGKLVSVKDGVSGIAKARPELLEAAGTRGAGVNSDSVRDGAGLKTMSRADFENLPATEKVKLAKEGVTLQ